MSLSELSGQPRKLTVRVRGEAREYPVHPLTLDDLGKLQGWVDAQFPDPFAVVGRAIGRGDYTVTQQQYLLDRAIHRATQPRHLIGTPEADRVLFSLEGHCELLKLAIRKGRELSDDEARELYMHLTVADLAALHATTGLDLVTHDPKGSPATSGESGSSTSRGRRRPARTGGTSTTAG